MELPVEWDAALTHEPTARHLDGVVAERVLGWRRPSRPYQPWDKRPDVPGVMLCSQADLPRFCTDIAAAWDVVEKLRERFTIDLSFERSLARVRIFSGDRYDMLPGAVRDLAQVEAQTAPMAICLAALQAVEDPNREEVEIDRAQNVTEVHDLIARLDHALRVDQARRNRDGPAAP